ncbi:MAG: hypothetical protein WBC89_07460 [Dehalococcoidia bacterium]
MIEVLFMLKETWPTKSSVAVGKVAVQILSMPLPSYVKMYGPFVTLGGDGIKVYTVYDAEKGHEEEWHKELMKQQAEHFGIEGFKSSVEVVLSVQDALPLVGLSL